jgi:hypothetical protein
VNRVAPGNLSAPEAPTDKIVRSRRPKMPQSGMRVLGQPFKIRAKVGALQTNIPLEFIKHYPTSAVARWAVDVPAKSVYAAARNLVFGA